MKEISLENLEVMAKNHWRSAKQNAIELRDVIQLVFVHEMVVIYMIKRLLLWNPQGPMLIVTHHTSPSQVLLTLLK